jgi:hypothetical protein
VKALDVKLSTAEWREVEAAIRGPVKGSARSKDAKGTRKIRAKKK